MEREKSTSRPKFIIDSMLGNVAKKLRLMGFDSLYLPAMTGAEVLDISQGHGRVIVTRNSMLHKSAIKIHLLSVFLPSTDEQDQLLQVRNELGLAFGIDYDLVRCSACNFKLESVEKSVILRQIPDGVADRHDKFWQCPKCKRNYWRGTHMINLEGLVGRINAR